MPMHLLCIKSFFIFTNNSKRLRIYKKYEPSITTSKTIKLEIYELHLQCYVFFPGPVVESEFHDRENLELPGHQKELLQDIIKYSKYGILQDMIKYSKCGILQDMINYSNYGILKDMIKYSKNSI